LLFLTTLFLVGLAFVYAGRPFALVLRTAPLTVFLTNLYLPEAKTLTF